MTYEDFLLLNNALNNFENLMTTQQWEEWWMSEYTKWEESEWYENFSY